MTVPFADPSVVLGQWLEAFETALKSRDYRSAAELFLPDGHWRDLVSFSGSLHTVSGTEALETAFKESIERTDPSGFQIQFRTPPSFGELLDEPVVEGMFSFETAVGRGRGHVRLTSANGGPLLAWTLLTYLTELRGFEESNAAHLSRGASAVRSFGDRNWLEHRTESAAYADREPTVLIVGGGQCGLALAARLNQLNVDNLVVDQMARVGDNWRNRYRGLVLHNETPANHLPYMPFPESWPTYLSKDQVADWLEAYATALEVNFWTSTSFVQATFDGEDHCWNAVVRFADGTERVLRPRHVVMATGANGIAYMPEIPGLQDFVGEIVHSSKFADGRRFNGRRVVVFGSGNSAHDVAQDLYSHGASVTMIQRGSTTVVSVDPSARMNAVLYMRGLPIEDADTVAASIPQPVMVRTSQAMTERSKVLDKELLEGLDRAGFRTDWGEDETGWIMKYRRTLGGYYLNVGCSDLIVQRKIPVVQYAEVSRVVENGVEMVDGSLMEADLIVLATGYHTQEALIARMFGHDVAERVGPVWGLDDEGELRNVWRPTAQDQLWIMAGSLLQARFYSRLLALQIKAIEEGVALS